jgi:hypothetical protein
MIAPLLAALLLSATPQTQTSAASASDPTTDAVRLEDVEVTGRPLENLIRSFVKEVAAPNAYRGIARWDRAICVGAANLRGDAAQHLVDRVSVLAQDLGLEPGAPGCKPNLLIVATDDAAGFASHLVNNHKRALRMGGSGMDRGGAALRRFETTDSPVRWWQVSMPVDSDTGNIATRLPGMPAPIFYVSSASRLRTQIVDNIFRTIVVVDVNKVGNVDIDQLADYIAMISLAQINPEADTTGYASILNVFEDPESSPRLTDWDRAYLSGLYNAERNRKALLSGRTEIASAIQRAHRRVAIDAENGR